MSSTLSGYNSMWNRVIEKSISCCFNEADDYFKSKTRLRTCDLRRYKDELEVLYKQKRNWLKENYLPEEKEPILDFHKLSSIMCRCVIGSKVFSFDVKAAENIFDRIRKDVNMTQDDKIRWEIDNVYINYKLAFLIGEGIVFEDLLYWAQDKINKIKKRYSDEDIEKNTDDLSVKIQIYKQFIDKLSSTHRLYSYAASISHDDFITSTIIALMKNDYLMRDFDYLQFSISMFQWQEYTKKQHLYEILRSSNFKLELSDVV